MSLLRYVGMTNKQFVYSATRWIEKRYTLRCLSVCLSVDHTRTGVWNGPSAVLQWVREGSSPPILK